MISRDSPDAIRSSPKYYKDKVIIFYVVKVFIINQILGAYVYVKILLFLIES